MLKFRLDITFQLLYDRFAKSVVNSSSEETSKHNVAIDKDGAFIRCSETGKRRLEKIRSVGDKASTI